MDIPNISDTSFTSGVGRISELTGLVADESEALLLAYLQGAVDLALDQVAGDGPVPTSLNVLRADLFRWTCARASRILPEREVEVLLRIPGSPARSVLRTMRAMYEEALRELFLQRMRLDAAVRPSGSDDEGLTWTLEFTESALFDLVLSEIRRLPISRHMIQTVVSRSRIEIPRQVDVESGTLDVLEALGIEPPPDE